jgi:hypothetical protein
MDAAMPVLNGIEATRQIITAVPQSKITALSMHNDKRYILEMLKAGASGYMLKECAYEELVGTIRTVLDNRTYLSPSVNEIVINDYRPGRKRQEKINKRCASCVSTSYPQASNRNRKNRSIYDDTGKRPIIPDTMPPNSWPTMKGHGIEPAFNLFNCPLNKNNILKFFL